MTPLFVGFLVGASLLLLGREWMQLVRERREPGGEFPYEARTFRRRALVSLLLLTVAALIVNQPVVFEGAARAGLRLAYLSAYLVVVTLIYALLWIDFLEGRRLARRLKGHLLRTQADYARELSRLYGAAHDAASAEGRDDGERGAAPGGPPSGG